MVYYLPVLACPGLYKALKSATQVKMGKGLLPGQQSIAKNTAMVSHIRKPFFTFTQTIA